MAEVNDFTFKKEFYLMTKYNLDTLRTLIATLCSFTPAVNKIISKMKHSSYVLYKDKNKVKKYLESVITHHHKMC